MISSKKRATKKSKRNKSKRVSTNPVVRFATRLAVAVRGLKEVHALAGLIEPWKGEPTGNRMLVRKIGEIIKRTLKEAE